MSITGPQNEYDGQVIADLRTQLAECRNALAAATAGKTGGAGK